jgi:hypothetical protein
MRHNLECPRLDEYIANREEHHKMSSFILFGMSIDIFNITINRVRGNRLEQKTQNNGDQRCV